MVASYIRPETRPQAPENIDSAPGLSQAEASEDVVAASSELAPACISQPEQDPLSLITPLDIRPEIPSQGLEKIDSAPGILTARALQGFVAASGEPERLGMSEPL